MKWRHFALLLIVQINLSHVHGSSAYQECREALTTLLSAARSSVLELDSKIEYQLKRADKLNRHGCAKVSGLEWLGAGREIKRLKKNIRDARGNLEVGLGALHLQIRCVLERSNISIRFWYSSMHACCLSEPASPDEPNARRGIRLLSTHRRERYSMTSLCQSHCFKPIFADCSTVSVSDKPHCKYNQYHLNLTTCNKSTYRPWTG